ncbi:hypothetical protein LPB67_07135 [Undibacterium sp. Jales W-56]|uniref:hypothetical protein n=1 Tax=Undibacterium sp. Jales W-56 TaxID=2897325 RepID=UPI0021D1787C|nr:hypothetical protein [Undibacterium sp. Jales W-56]MCU6433551.1 hypothetical protein [Undibacterium sp. Jales W-56]
MTSATSSNYYENDSAYSERRGTRAPQFTLIELDPRDVIDGVMLEQGYLSDDAQSSGKMREICPHCSGVQLQLILRFRHVKRAHLFCDCCTRCYDALYPDGSSALALGAVSLV